MKIIEAVKKHWGWCGINPVELVVDNEFGNVMLRDDSGRFWRICPEDVYCKMVAETVDEYNLLITDDEFNKDWFMSSVVKQAFNYLGALKEGHKYGLIVSGVLGGEYGGKNFKQIPFVDLIAESGKLGYQIKDLPDGAKYQIKID